MEVSGMHNPSRRGRLWGIASITALALLGLVVAAAISLAASRLSSQHIGISSEPLSAGKSLSPVEDRQSQKQTQHQTRTRNRHRHRGSNNTQTQTTPAPPPVQLTPPAQVTPTPPATSTPSTGGGDDSGKDDSGGHGGRGGEDD
jgi:hypothetical protein